MAPFPVNSALISSELEQFLLTWTRFALVQLKFVIRAFRLKWKNSLGRSRSFKVESYIEVFECQHHVANGRWESTDNHVAILRRFIVDIKSDVVSYDRSEIAIVPWNLDTSVGEDRPWSWRTHRVRLSWARAWSKLPQSIFFQVSIFKSLFHVAVSQSQISAFIFEIENSAVGNSLSFQWVTTHHWRTHGHTSSWKLSF